MCRTALRARADDLGPPTSPVRRHAYFLGADDPYDKLRRALHANIDEAAWSSLNSSVSRPFPRPAGGRIAVKVINHYGDEILKVYAV